MVDWLPSKSDELMGYGYGYISRSRPIINALRDMDKENKSPAHNLTIGEMQSAKSTDGRSGDDRYRYRNMA